MPYLARCIGKTTKANGETRDRHDEEHEGRTLDPDQHPPGHAMSWRTADYGSAKTNARVPVRV